MIMGAFGVSVSTFSGQNFGAGKIDRVKKCLGAGTVLAMCSAVLVSGVVLPFGKYILMLFADDANVLEIGEQMVRLDAVSCSHML